MSKNVKKDNEESLENCFCAFCNRRHECGEKYVNVYKDIFYTIGLELSERILIRTPSSKFIKKDIVFDICGTDKHALVYTAFFDFCSRLVMYQEPYRSYVSFLKEKYPDEDFSSGGMGSNPIYKKRKDYFKKLSEKYNVPVETFMRCNRYVFDLWEFFFKNRFNRGVRKSNSENKHLEKKRPFEKDLFGIMSEYVYPKDNNYGKTAFKNDLEMMDVVYDAIEEESDSYLEKCLKYHFCELITHYETAYKFVYILENQSKLFNYDEKTSILFWEANLRSVRDRDNNGALIRFPVMLNKENYIEHFLKELEYNKSHNRDHRPNECAKLLNILTESCIMITDKMTQKYSKQAFINPTLCGFAEFVLKDYIGMGQHICRNKEFDDVIVEDLMEIYSSADTVEERLEVIKRKKKL